MSSPLENILPKMEATHEKFKAFVLGLDAEAVLQGLPDDAWAKQGDHPALGDPKRAE